MPDLKSAIPSLNHLEGLLSPNILAESITKVLQPEEIRQMIQFLNQALTDL